MNLAKWWDKMLTFRNQGFFSTNNEISETEIRKNVIYYSNMKNKSFRNKLNQGNKRPVLRKLQNTVERN